MESTGIPAPPLAVKPQPIAPWLHTAAILSVLVLTTALGHMRAETSYAASAPDALRYISTMLLEWLLLGSVIAGIYRRRPFLLQAIGARVPSLPQSFLLGLAVYLLGLIAIAATGGALSLTPLRNHTNERLVVALMPHTPWQFMIWFGVSLTAGICEEFIFRGYLLQQFTAWTGRPWLAIVLTALLFGSVHLYEGLGAILPLAALALVYGFVVHRSHDLRVVIVAHTLQDFLVALLILMRPHLDHYQLKH